MLAWIRFSDQLWPWSALTFWMVVISVISTLGFTVAVLVGGLGDLRFLLSALDEEQVDRTDDGRVVAPPAETAGPDASVESERSSH